MQEALERLQDVVTALAVLVGVARLEVIEQPATGAARPLTQKVQGRSGVHRLGLSTHSKVHSPSVASTTHIRLEL